MYNAFTSNFLFFLNTSSTLNGHIDYDNIRNRLIHSIFCGHFRIRIGGRGGDGSGVDKGQKTRRIVITFTVIIIRGKV